MFFFSLCDFRKTLTLWGLATVSLNLDILPTYAQIINDNTVNTHINKIGNRQIITEGKQVGTNLFHSFTQFSVPKGTIVQFDNDLAIKNIFARITGGSISQINGLISANGNASLFLLNPAGIILDANAQLNLGGSFIATTANSIIFADGVEFSTDTSVNQPLLTVSLPIGLQYGKAPGQIMTSYSQLSILPENTLALLGGDIVLEKSSLNANSGRIEIGSLTEGRVGLQPNINGWKFDYGQVQRFGQIELKKSTNLDTTGSKGIVQLQGENIQFTDGSVITNFTIDEENGGNINLIGKNSIELDNSFLFTQVGFDPTIKNITGNGGNIVIKTEKLKLKNGSVIVTGTLGQGNGGDLIINATELVELSGKDNSTPSALTSATEGEGMGGSLTINTKKLIVRDGGQIRSATFAEGNAGKLIVNATDSIELLGKTNFIDGRLFNSGLFASSGSQNSSSDLQSTGKSGNLIVNTPELTIAQGGEISASNFGLENGGDIQINAEELTLDRDSKIIANTASGKGGALALNVSFLLLQDQSTISTTAASNGNGGNIKIAADTLALLDNSTINANAFAGNGGNIKIGTEGLFIAPNAQITASSNLSTDGIVEIFTPNLESTLNLTISERSPLKAEDSVYTSCNQNSNFVDNQFNYIGRGGLPLNPLEEVAVEESWVDLGFGKQTNPNLEQSSIETLSARQAVTSEKNIVEANNWIVNEKGNIELTAQNSIFPSLQESLCSLNSQ